VEKVIVLTGLSVYFTTSFQYFEFEGQAEPIDPDASWIPIKVVGSFYYPKVGTLKILNLFA